MCFYSLGTLKEILVLSPGRKHVDVEASDIRNSGDNASKLELYR